MRADFVVLTEALFYTHAHVIHRTSIIEYCMYKQARALEDAALAVFMVWSRA